MARKHKRQRRARGTGSVYFDTVRGVWVAKKVVGRTPAGKLKYLQRSGETQKKALSSLDEASGAPLSRGERFSLGQWLARWQAEDTSRPYTKAARATSVKTHIVPILGGVSLRELATRDVESAIRQWSQSLEPNSVRLVCSHLSTAMEAARRAGLVVVNPLKGVRRPKAARSKIVPFTPDELRRIIELAATRRPWRMFALLAASGCRIGEALALDVVDVDAKAGKVSISHTQQADRTRGPTKTANGVRTIAVPAAASALVGAVDGRHTGPLFATRKGGRECTQNAHYSWAALLGELGLAYRNPHQLRHSVATALISSGVPIGDVAAYLGDTVETIVKTYLHKTGACPGAAMARIIGHLAASHRAA